MKDKNQTLKWRFDVSTFRLIGRELITDRVTALFELVKNCYDANACQVTVRFTNVGADKQNAVIEIIDDGCGMSFEDIRDKWMVIGTSSKRKNPYSPEPFHRRCVGEKGIGRFAVDKLGDKTRIITKTAGEKEWLNVVIDWSFYEHNDTNDILLFTDIENDYQYSPADKLSESGTKLVISAIREYWTKSEIEQLIRQISKIRSPFVNKNDEFQVRVVADEFGINQNAIHTIEETDIATASFTIDFNEKNNTQESIFFDKKSSSFKSRNIPIDKDFGGIKMRVYFFDGPARAKYRKAYPNDSIDGFKVYRDGIITTPFAEANKDQDKKRDILGIDKRVWQDIFNRISTREFLGSIELTRDGNPNIIDATNRQDFVDNEAYRKFKDFIVLQLNALQAYKETMRKKQKEEVSTELNSASENINQFITTISDFAQQNSSLKPTVDILIKQAKKTGQSVKNAIKEQKKVEEDFTRKENIYMSIMSLQDYAIQIAHAVRTTLNQMKDRIEFFYRYYPDPEEEELFKLYAKEMFQKYKVLHRVIDFMLSYSQSNLNPEEIVLKEIFEEILNDYSHIFDQENIKVDSSFPVQLKLTINKQFFRDILQNLIDNSIKAMANAKTKILKVSYEALSNNLVIKVSDTGVGIPVERREQVFALYYTTTQDKGGAGVGLYIVKTRVESLKGTVSIEDSEFGEIGTTVKIVIPFKH